jgi:RNA polymerase sigma factor (sigma-70 family)
MKTYCIKIKLIEMNSKDRKHYSSYIKKVVNSTIIDYLRKSRRQQQVISFKMQERIFEKKAAFKEKDGKKNLFKKKIISAVESLIESRKKVVKLYLLDLTIEEISILFNWSENKTRNLLYRGLSDLKKKLMGNGIEYEDKP